MNFLGLIWIASYFSGAFSPQNWFRASEYLSRSFASTTLPIISSIAHSPVDKTIQAPTVELRIPAATRTFWNSFSAHSASIRIQTHPTQFFATTLPSWLSSLERSLTVTDLIGQFSFSFPHFQLQPLSSISPFRPESQDDRTPNQLKKLWGTVAHWSNRFRKSANAIVTVTWKSASARSLESAPLDQQKQAMSWRCIPQKSLDAVRGLNLRGVFQIHVKGYLVAELPSREQADVIATRLRAVLKQPTFNIDDLTLTMVDDRPTGKIGSEALFTVDSRLASALKRDADLIAIDWLNNLRVALRAEPLTLVQAQTQLYGLIPTEEKLTGTASWYGPYFHGRLTAAGETFNENELTAAHPSLPFDTYLKVTNQETGNSVVVRVNDRGPYVGDRSLDLSREAARCLDSEYSGVVRYSATIMQPAPIENADAPNLPQILARNP